MKVRSTSHAWLVLNCSEFDSYVPIFTVRVMDRVMLLITRSYCYKIILRNLCTVRSITLRVTVNNPKLAGTPIPSAHVH